VTARTATPRITNIRTSPLIETPTRRGDTWRHLDLGGDHLGVRIEELQPGDVSSIHHFHTLEEEHVLALSGAATLHLGADQIGLNEGDHVWFPAGEAVAHHIENHTASPFRYLVFGERQAGDVIVYPKGRVMLVKALGNVLFRYDAVDDPRERRK
jgi:uncharacterized cupin superfamily protein